MCGVVVLWCVCMWCVCLCMSMCVVYECVACVYVVCECVVCVCVYVVCVFVCVCAFVGVAVCVCVSHIIIGRTESYIGDKTVGGKSNRSTKKFFERGASRLVMNSSPYYGYHTFDTESVGRGNFKWRNT